MKTYFQTPIASTIDAQNFLISLSRDGLSFHPDDSAASIVNTASGLPIFAPDECHHVDARMHEVFMHLDDPYSFLMDMNDGQ